MHLQQWVGQVSGGTISSSLCFPAGLIKSDLRRQKANQLVEEAVSVYTPTNEVKLGLLGMHCSGGSKLWPFSQRTICHVTAGKSPGVNNYIHVGWIPFSRLSFGALVTAYSD